MKNYQTQVMYASSYLSFNYRVLYARRKGCVPSKRFRAPVDNAFRKHTGQCADRVSLSPPPPLICPSGQVTPQFTPGNIISAVSHPETYRVY